MGVLRFCLLLKSPPQQGAVSELEYPPEVPSQKTARPQIPFPPPPPRGPNISYHSTLKLAHGPNMQSWSGPTSPLGEGGVSHDCVGTLCLRLRKVRTTPSQQLAPNPFLRESCSQKNIRRMRSGIHPTSGPPCGLQRGPTTPPSPSPRFYKTLRP